MNKLFSRITRTIKSACWLGIGVGFLVAISPAQGQAPAMTQLEFIQWMVQLSGDSGMFKATSTPAEYIHWAESQGMKPLEGWQANATLTRDTLAQALVQFFNISSGKKKGADFVRILLREGIQLPDEAAITRAGFVSIIDDFGFQSRTAKMTKNKHTVVKPTKPPKPPKPPKVPTPKKQPTKKPTPGKP